MLSQMAFGMGIVPAACRSRAILLEFSPGMRMPAPDALTAARIDAALPSKSSTSAEGWIAMKVWPQLLAAFLDSHWPSTAPPLSAPG